MALRLFLLGPGNVHEADEMPSRRHDHALQHGDAAHPDAVTLPRRVAKSPCTRLCPNRHLMICYINTERA